MNAHSVPVAARMSSQWSSDLPEKVRRALDDYDIERTSAFRDVSALAQSVELDSYSIDFDSTVIQDDLWIAPGTLYVVLRYDVNSAEPVELNDAYPLELRFKNSEDKITIVDMFADTRSFYE